MRPELLALERWLAPAAFIALSVAFALVEQLRPRRAVRPFRDGVGLDVLGVVIAAVVSGGASAATLKLLPAAPPLLPGPLAHPVLVGVLFFVATDLSRFFMHWLMHRSWAWRFHRFHHSPTQIYWLSGNRASPVHVVLFAAPTTALAWLLAPGLWVYGVNVVAMVFWNHFMHTNFALGPRLERLLEYVVTTPRYHHVHHANDPALYDRNLASIFTLWDRLAGTYVDPSTVPEASLAFGLDETPQKARMVLGL